MEDDCDESVREVGTYSKKTDACEKDSGPV